ncbi:unnamed protein product [Staurois parvus]|uniref:NADH dehydrogenase subunit 1 n=1 Tax=Staurois parvus TaxID=386267 RepID=A0ABN9BMK2_9NEOB|nr:unnamed protein product [Staurois parvus]
MVAPSYLCVPSENSSITPYSSSSLYISSLTINFIISSPRIPL